VHQPLQVAAAPPGGDGRIVFQASVGTSRQLFTIRADGTELRQVTHVAFSGVDKGAEQPTWSPDGTRIAFDAPSDDGTSIFTIGSKGGGLRKVRIGSSGSSAAPAYSPDGGELAFDHRADRSKPSAQGIFAAAADGTHPHRVTTAIRSGQAYDTAATWSPDRTRLCFTRAKDAQLAALYVIRIDGSGLKRLTPWNLDASAASWSPDGSKLAFESYSTPHPGKSANLFSISPSGGAMKQLTHFKGGATHAFGPAWSPDGKKIVWHKLGPQLNQLFVMDSGGENQRQLTQMPGNAKLSHPEWGPGG
jgi:TolB protein